MNNFVVRRINNLMREPSVLFIYQIAPQKPWIVHYHIYSDWKESNCAHMGSSCINFNPAPVSIYRLLALASSIAFLLPVARVSLRIFSWLWL